jgi:hypothetical protein
VKFWFAKKTPKDVYDGKAPYDATVEQVLRVAQEVNSAPAETDGDIFDLVKAFRPEAAAAAPPSFPAVPVPSRPTVSRAMRDDMERRLNNYRAFQKKLNDEREARIRQTMDDIRIKLKQSAQDSPLH